MKTFKNEQYEINEQYECKKRTIPVKMEKKGFSKANNTRNEQYQMRTILDANNTRDILVMIDEIENLKLQLTIIF